MKTLETLFHDTPRDVYCAERAIRNAAPLGAGPVCA